MPSPSLSPDAGLDPKAESNIGPCLGPVAVAVEFSSEAPGPDPPPEEIEGDSMNEDSPGSTPDGVDGVDNCIVVAVAVELDLLISLPLRPLPPMTRSSEKGGKYDGGSVGTPAVIATPDPGAGVGILEEEGNDPPRPPHPAPRPPETSRYWYDRCCCCCCTCRWSWYWRW